MPKLSDILLIAAVFIVGAMILFAFSEIVQPWFERPVFG